MLGLGLGLELGLGFGLEFSWLVLCGIVRGNTKRGMG